MRTVIVRSTRWLALAVVAGLCVPAMAAVQPVEVPPMDNRTKISWTSDPASDSIA